MAACPAATVGVLWCADAAEYVPVLFPCAAPEIHPARIFKRSRSKLESDAVATSTSRSLHSVHQERQKGGEAVQPTGGKNSKGTGMAEECEKMGCFFSSQGWGARKWSRKSESCRRRDEDERERRENMREQTRGDRGRKEDQKERKGEGGPMGVAKPF